MALMPIVPMDEVEEERDEVGAGRNMNGVGVEEEDEEVEEAARGGAEAVLVGGGLEGTAGSARTRLPLLPVVVLLPGGRPVLLPPVSGLSLVSSPLTWPSTSSLHEEDLVDGSGCTGGGIGRGDSPRACRRCAAAPVVLGCVLLVLGALLGVGVSSKEGGGEEGPLSSP